MNTIGILLIVVCVEELNCFGNTVKVVKGFC